MLTYTKAIERCELVELHRVCCGFLCQSLSLLLFWTQRHHSIRTFMAFICSNVDILISEHVEEWFYCGLFAMVSLVFFFFSFLFSF